MKFSINEIKNEIHEQPYYFDEKVNVADIKSSNNDIRKIDFVQVKGMCTIDKEEIIFSYHITGELILPCARTLVDVPYPLDINATDVFTTAAFLTEEDEENEVHQVTGDELDLKPYIRENILLALPFRVFSDEKVIEKGEGWHYFTEESFTEKEKKKIDPRLEKLKILLDNNNDENET